MRNLSIHIIEADQEKYRSIMSTFMYAFFLGKPDGTLLEVNQYACDMFGYSADEFKKLQRQDYIEIEDATLKKNIKERNEKGSLRFELTGIRKNGERFPIEVSSVLFKDINGEERSSSLVIDISKRKAAEIQVTDTERRYNNLFDQNLVGVFRSTPKGKMLACNKAYAEMLGYESPQDILHLHASELYFSTTVRDELITRLRLEKKLFNIELIVKRKDGTPLYVIENISLTKDPLNDEEIIEGILINITDRKDAEAALQKSYEEVLANAILLKNAEKLSHTGSWSINLLTGTIKWSDESYRIFGYEPEETTPSLEFFLSHVHPEDVDDVKSVIANGFRKVGVQKFQYRIIDKKGRLKFIQAENLVEHNTAGEPVHITGFNMDVTEKTILETKLAEERLIKHQEITRAVITAQEQERTSIGEELHDNINQVLTTARLYLESALNEANIRKDLIEDSRNFIISAINEIRDISKSLLPPALGDISLQEAINDLLQNISRLQKMQFSMKWELADENLLSDKLKLTIFRIVQEQLNNIITHAKAAGMTVGLLQKGKHLLLSITDDGIGFDPVQKRTGVGLQNITSRTELFNGTISIHSAPGKGCELKIYFPL